MRQNVNVGWGLSPIFLLGFAFAQLSAQGKVVDLVFPGSFDELVSTNGEYRIEGKVSSDDMYGYNASLVAEEETFFSCAAHNHADVKNMYVENYSSSKIRINSIPVGVQTVSLRYEVDIAEGQTNSSVTCLYIERAVPFETNTIKNVVSSFPNLEVLIVRLSFNYRDDARFDVGECIGNGKLRVLYLTSSHPLTNLASLDRLTKLEAMVVQYEGLGVQGRSILTRSCGQSPVERSWDRPQLKRRSCVRKEIE